MKFKICFFTLHKENFVAWDCYVFTYVFFTSLPATGTAEYREMTRLTDDKGYLYIS